MDQITTHAADAVARLPTQDRGRANIESLIGLVGSRAQDVENALWGLLAGLAVGTGTGTQLDTLGRIVGQARQSMDDATYRLWIQARILVNKSSGTPADIVAVVAALVANATIFTEYSPAAFILRLVDALDLDGGSLRGSRTVHVKPPSTWGPDIHIDSWWFDGGGWPAMEWPGEPMTPEADGWWRYTYTPDVGQFAPTAAPSLLFHDNAGNATSNQVTDLSRESWFYNNLWHDLLAPYSQILAKTRAGGVRGVLQVSGRADANLFAFCKQADVNPVTGYGPLGTGHGFSGDPTSYVESAGGGWQGRTFIDTAGTFDPDIFPVDGGTVLLTDSFNGTQQVSTYTASETTEISGLSPAVPASWTHAIYIMPLIGGHFITEREA